MSDPSQGQASGAASTPNLDAHLAALPPESQARVQDALKANIASEIAGQPLRAAEFSRGVFFSRSRGSGSQLEDQVVQQAANLDSASFQKFAQNLATLKNVQSQGQTAGQ